MAPPLQVSTSVSFTNSSNTPFPSSLRHNKSFAKLAGLLGLTAAKATAGNQQCDGIAKGSLGDAGDEQDEDGEDGDEDEGEIDEDSLLWDAQTALIAHHPALAIQHYTLAALPPYRSSPACLALGNLLTRGSGLAPPALSSADTATPSRFTASEKGKGRAYSFGPASPPLPSSPGVSKQDQRRGSAAQMSASPPQSAVSRFMGFVWPTSPPESAPVSPPERTYTDLAGTGWAIPKEGKRAVRDVEGMGIAGGWFILGLGWIVDGQVSMVPIHSSPSREGAAAVIDEYLRRSRETETDEDTLFIDTKSKGKTRQSAVDQPIHLVVRIEGTAATLKSEDNTESTSSEGTTLKTPSEEEEGEARADKAATIKLIYDLLQPLLQLYRNGHIQSNDPVYLPPITYAQLPTCLLPQGDMQKRRNVWNLGGTVLKKLLDLPIMQDAAADKKALIARRRGVEIMARYISAMTGPASESEEHYRKIISLGQSGLEYPDEIVRHASKHLYIITSPPLTTPQLVPHTSRRTEYPFPAMKPPTNHLVTPDRCFTSPSRKAPASSRKHRQMSSMSSISSARRLGTPIKSFPSIASLAEEGAVVPVTIREKTTGSTGAMDTLRRVQAKSSVDLVAVRREAEGSDAWWPSISSWSYSKAKEKLSPMTSGSNTPTESSNAEPDPVAEDVIPSSKSETARPTAIIVSLPTPSPTEQIATRPQIPTIRTVASTPTFGSLRDASATQPKLPSGTATPRPFDHLHANINTAIDPALAAAELASTMTKRVKCGVCRTEGYNFPGCRRCGLVFCSRECRVSGDKAGDGKRHVCGVWESRKGLCVPEAQNGRGKVAERQMEVGTEVMAC